GLPVHGPDAYRQFVGEGASQLVRNALPPGRDELLPELLSAYRAHYLAHLIVHTQPYPGIRELLSELQGRGLPLAVLSNKPHELTTRIAAALFPEVRFAGVLGQRPNHPRKPDPAGALELCSALGRPASEIALVGDTRTDMQTANAAGMIAVGVRWGFRDAPELTAHGARHLISKPADLLPLVSKGTRLES
ncbi:MAG TPA: HAD family hydrolase, partial [Polyangiales bacterium]|nr:HAD family hydrolase [Polyangiales bacterium]